MRWYRQSMIMALTILLISTANLWSQLKIMPLGDSITKGEIMLLSENEPNPTYIADKVVGYHISGAGGTIDDGIGGYRPYLSEMLQLLGWDFQFVGELTDTTGAHEGHDGFMSSDLLTALPQILTANTPDVVLLHIGTNDLPTPVDADSCYANIRSMVQKIESVNPNIQVFVARIIPCLTNTPLAVTRYPEIERLNTLLNALPNEFQTVKLVDMWAAFTNTPNWEAELMSDTWHPSEAGYSFMAEIWRNKLIETIDGTVPEITGVSPDTGLSDTAEFTCTITGSDFQAATTLYLQGTLGQLLPASQVTVIDAATIAATFDLSQAAAGEWIVTARNPNQMRSIHTTDVVLHVTNTTSSGGYTQRINAGGSNLFDSEGLFWIADQSYSSGSYGYVGGSTYRTYDAISETTSDIVYQTERWGLSAYRFSVPNGNYQVQLHFAEIYLQAANKRIIDVHLEGAPALTNLDIFAEVGHDAALVKTLNTITVSDGILDIEFFRDVEDPKISGIEVIAQSTEPTLYVDTNAVDFGAFSKQKTISLTNIGSGELSWSLEDVNRAQWLGAISPAEGVLTSGQNQQILLDVNRDALAVGDYSTTLSINSNGGEKSLNITLNVPAAAHLNVSPQALDLTAVQSSGTFIISNSGEDSLRWTASQASSQNWIGSILPAQGVIAGGEQQTVSMAVNRSSLSDGSYTSSLEIVATEALNSPQTLPITMQVSDDVQQIPQFESWETELVSTTHYDHPFLAVELAAVFTTPSGKTVTLNGFWAGGNTWKIRFMPEEIGTYTYITASTETSLHQQTGSFACGSSSHPGKLMVDQDHPYTFSYSRGGHFFWFGETNWLMMSDGAPYETIFKPYIDQRVAQNFNAIHFVLGTGGLPVGTSNPRNEGGYLWLVQNKEINPAFFDWMDLRMDYLHDKQMAVGFFITWAQNFAQFSRTEYERFEKYLMARYSAYPLLYWVIVGEFDEAGDIGEYNYHGTVLEHTDPYDHLVSNHPGHSDPDNIGSSRIFANQDWFNILIQQFPRYPGQLSPAEINAEVIRDRVYNTPVVNIEYGYEEHTYNNRLFTADDVRQHAWAIMTGGGFFSYGHWESIRDIDLSYLNSQGVTYLQHLRDFFIDLDWWEMAPDNDRVSQGFCLAQAGEEYVIYLPDGGGVTVNLPDGDLFAANWLNPRTGSSINSSVMLAGSYKSYYPPFSGDAVLHLKKTSGTAIAVNPLQVTFEVTDNNPSPPSQSIEIYEPSGGILSWTATEYPEQGWLMISPNTGSSGNNLTVQVNAAGLEPGLYQSNIEITDPAAINNPILIPVQLTVTSSTPEISISPVQLNFNMTVGTTQTTSETVTVNNVGAGTLSWNAQESIDKSWLSLTDGSGTNGDTFSVSATGEGLSAGTYTGSVTITDPTAINSPVTVSVQLTISPEVTGPVLGEFEAENTPDLPNSAWEMVVNDGENAILATVNDISSPPEQYQLNYTFSVPDGVNEVYVFAEIDVNGDRNDDSFWVEVNENSTCSWNNLYGLGDGWTRSWIYHLGKDMQHAFPVQPGINTLNLYPRENGASVNWLVVTTDEGTDLDAFTFGGGAPLPDAPQLAATPNTLTFSAIEAAANPDAQSLAISNSGTGSINWTAVEYPEQTWLNLNNTSATGDGTISINTDITGLAVGTYTTAIRITDANAANSPLDVPVTLTVTSNQPEITLNPTTITFAATESSSNPANQTVTVTNTGAGTLNWTATEAPDESWLTISNTTGITGGQFALAININSLSAGSYSANIQVTDPTAINSPVTVPVQLTINPEITGPVLGEFEAENASELPNSGWESLVNEGENSIRAAVNDISSPPAQYQLNYTFTVPEGVSEVYAFAEVDVNGDGNDDSFWVEVNQNSTCSWNNLSGLKDGWKRSWVYNQGKDTQHAFPVQPGINTLNLYPRENGAAINWLVITTDAGTDLDAFTFGGGTPTPPPPDEPQLAATPSALTFSAVAAAANPAAQNLAISNSGTGSINWTAVEYPEQSWLNLNNTSATGSGTISVSTDITGLAAGTYTTTIHITDINANNSPLDVPVTLNVTSNQPQITLNPTTITFSTTEGSSNPTNQAVTVTNTGAGTLNWTTTETTDQNWIQISNPTGTTGGQFTLSVDITGLSVGTHTATVSVSDPTAINNPVTVPVQLTINPEITGPVLGEFEAEDATELPNSGWVSLVNEGENAIQAAVNDISSPPAQYQLNYTFTVPEGVSEVYAFAEVDVNGDGNDDSFWVEVNENSTCSWNNLSGLKDGWARSWVYNQGKDTQHAFPVQPGINTLNLYPRENGASVNWLVVTTDNGTDLGAFTFGGGTPLPDAPQLAASPNALTFSAVAAAANPAAQNLAISNSGTGSINWTAVEYPEQSWLNLNNTSAAGNGTISVSTDITGLAAGTYTTTIRITDANAANSPLDVPVTLNVVSNQPKITLNPTTINFTATEGSNNPANQTVTVTNSGAGTLNWTAAETSPQSWLTLSNTTGGQLFLAVDINSLSAGTYSASIQVTDPTAINSPKILPVQLTISPEVTGPVLGEFEAENAPDLPNSGWETVVNDGENAILAAVNDITSPPAQYQLNYTFTVPDGVSEVFVFAEVDVNGARNDDSFWVEVNENSACSWNNLYGLGDGWARSWIYNLGKDTQHAFPVQPGINTLNLYPRENGAVINWLVITTDAGTDLNNYSSATTGTDTPVVTVSPIISVSTDTLQFTLIENEVSTAAQTITVSNSGGGTLEWTFSEVPAFSWLSTQKSGDTIVATVNASGLAVGQYQTALEITGVNAENSPVTIPVLLEVVENTPIIAVTKTHLTFSAIAGETNELTQTIVLSNSGGGTLSWYANEKIDQSWLILSGDSGTDGDTLTVTINSAGLNTGNYAAVIRITDVNAANNPIEITIDLTLMQPTKNPEILAELQAEHSLSLPNDGWEIVVNDADTCIRAIQADLNEPNEAYRLDYKMTFPAGTEKVYIFAEIDVNNNYNHDSFWVSWNENDLCNWNALKPLARDGWKRLWVFDYLQDTQHEFTAQPDTNIISIYSKEAGPYLNWLVITTDPNWDIENHEIGTGLAKQTANNVKVEVPKKFQLLPNYPNPFNPETTITLDVPATQEISLVIYNTNGQEVATLHKGICQPGRYAVTWNGRNSQGRVVPSGTYLCRLKTGMETHVIKMTFVK